MGCGAEPQLTLWDSGRNEGIVIVQAASYPAILDSSKLEGKESEHAQGVELGQEQKESRNPEMGSVKELHVCTLTYMFVLILFFTLSHLCAF